jgi:hypothetical protein
VPVGGYWARLDRVLYANARDEAAAIGFDDEWLYREVPKPVEAAACPCAAAGREALEVFRDWAAKPDKVPY